MATLTTVKSDQLTDIESVPSEKVDVTQNYGRLRVLYGSYTVDTADEFGTDGLIRMFTIPKGARVIGGEISCPATGATGIFEVGWAADADAVETADPNGFWTSQDPGAAAVDAVRMSSTVPGYFKKFNAACEVQCDWTEASADAGTKTIECVIFIVVD